MMDFCSHFMTTKIECSAPAVDEYPVSNLISTDRKLRDAGFFCESFIRPPVDVVVRFDAPVDIFHLLFCTRVRQQQGVSYAVLTSSQTSVDDSIQLRVAQFTTNGEDCVHLTNTRYTRWYRYPEELKNTKIAELTEKKYSVYEAKLRNSNHDALLNVRILRIRILRNTSAGGSGISNLEIWGHPGCMTSREEKLSVIEGWSKHYIEFYVNRTNIEDQQAAKHYFYRDMSLQISEIDSGIVKSAENIASESNLHKNSFDAESTINKLKNDLKVDDIPEDFLDPITCELMILPILLPSGNSIDVSTLEKLNHLQRMNNRLPSDPFTGIVFNDLVQPIPNIKLKARIDRFVLLHQESAALVGTGKTLLSEPNSLCLNPLKSCKGISEASSSPSTVSDHKFSNLNRQRSKNIANNNKSAILKRSFHQAGLSITDCSNKLNKGYKSSAYPKIQDVYNEPKLNVSIPFKCNNYNSANTIGGGHKGLPQVVGGPSRLASLAVPRKGLARPKGCQEIVQGDAVRPEFKAFSRDSLLKGSEQCCKCSSHDMLYELRPCGHLHCRSCLLHLSDSGLSTCHSCALKVKSTDVCKHRSVSVFKNS